MAEFKTIAGKLTLQAGAAGQLELPDFRGLAAAQVYQGQAAQVVAATERLFFHPHNPVKRRQFFQ